MADTTNIGSLSRRAFLKSSGAAALLVGFALPGGSGSRAARAEAPLQVNAFLRIDTDGTVTILANHSEFGNGAYTIIPMLVAEELEVPWESIRLEAAPTRPEYYSPVFGEYLTAGSITVFSLWEPLRTAGAQAKAMLMDAAAAEWDVPPEQVTAQVGVVRAGDRQAGYGELVAVAQARNIPLRESVTLKTPADFTVLGRDRRRFEGRSKVTGEARFGIDIKLPGMLYASILRSPAYGGRPQSFEDSETLKVPGVVKAKAISNGVAVLATNYWSARKGRDALTVTWDEGPNTGLSSEGFFEEYRVLADKPGMLAEDIGDSLSVLAAVQKPLEAVYELPYLAHVTLEPMNATARVETDRCEIWSGTQYQSNDQERVAALLGLPQQAVTIHRPLMGGSFGRRSSKTADFTIEAVEVARGESVPVQVIWSREEDVRSGFYRPLFVHKLRGTVDDDGMPLAWHQTVVGQSIMQHTKHDPAYMVDGMDIYSLDGCLQEPFGVFSYGTSYAIPNHRVETHNPPKVGVAPQEWRSVGHSHTGVAYECFLDELAYAGGRDSFDVRQHLARGNARMSAVLAMLREKSDWDAPLPEGWGRGVAARVYSVTPIAQVAEVSTDDGNYRVERVVCVVDCGFAVNPLNIEAQLQGGIAMGLSAVAGEEIVLERGRILQSNYHDYPVLRLNQMPRIEVHIIDSQEVPTGVGEQALAPTAPAVLNALFAATGRRIRRLPIRHHGLQLS
ncbi:xanthine dehydrogenase family protein molybdopterin-binding subunit [Pseudohaliea rubra]|uniref:Isoquinoline 1-oxidoreductase beta subunit n=1 Tax=Pseudohaliea rubra DSM 19751 TaxID=1265313 RepID=A0A095VRA3_9GAMM|nr:molybdopterin cofactor-binding domain-containing protein [Pseudohaliea rubra]KGE03915.1 Isoquinoline 1-oxidoreductase beta subunit [Pseudohaliea rubra DSM 19751]